MWFCINIMVTELQNSADSDQTVPPGATWSESTLIAKIEPRPNKNMCSSGNPFCR